MLLLTHIIIALSSLAFASYMLFRPSRAKLYVNYGMIAATLTTGTVLIVSSGHGMLMGCISGLTYTVLTVGASLFARHKLASQEI